MSRDLHDGGEEQNKRLSEETVSIKFQRQKPAWWGSSRNDRKIHRGEAYAMRCKH